MPLVVPVLPSVSLNKQNILQCSILIFFLLSPYTKITLFTASTMLQISLSLPLSHVLSLPLLLLSFLNFRFTFPKPVSGDSAPLSNSRYANKNSSFFPKPALFSCF